MLGKIGLGLLVTTVMAGGYIMQDGFVHVSVDEFSNGGTHLHLVVPAQLATIAAHFIPARHLERVHHELGDLLPTLKLAAAELAKLPDAVLVEVRDAQNHVLVSKSGDGLLVEEESREEHVRVWVPLRAIYDTAGVLQSRADAN